MAELKGRKTEKNYEAAVVVLAAAVVAAVVIVTVVVLVVVLAGRAVVVIAAAVVAAAAVAVFGVLLRPLVTGVAAFPVTMSTDKATDPCPTVVVPLVRALPSL